jgi:site-specific recombinase XerD
MFVSKGYNGIYDLYFTNPSTGKRTKVTTCKSTLREALTFKRRFQIDDFVGNHAGKPSVVNLVQLQEDVMEYALNNLSPKTSEIYRLSMTDLIRTVGNKPLAYLGMKDFERLKNIRVSSVSRTTVNIELRTLKAIMNYAVRNGYVESNPAHNVRQFTIPQKEKLSFEEDEILVLLSHLTNPLIRNIVLFALYTGCRLSEIINLQMRDMNLSERIITIRNKPDFKTKTGRIRQFPISDTLFEFLKQFTELAPNEYLFNLNGKKLSKDYVSHNFKKVLRKGGLPEKYHFHCLRHNFITNLIRNGVHLNYVKELAGHTDIQTTMGYIHIELEDLRKAVNNVKVAV